MKARVKATGKIIEVQPLCGPPEEYRDAIVGTYYDIQELEILDDDPIYWEKLKHQYAGMAMQGMIRTVGHDRMYPPEKIAIYAVACATALVNKLKSESNG